MQLALWNENVSCHISHQQFLASKCEGELPKLWPSGAATPHSDCWGAGRTQEARWTGKQRWPQLAPGACERNEFSKPKGLHLPMHRMLNSLTWYLIFDFQTFCSLYCKLIYSQTSPSCLLGAVFSELLMLSPRLSVLHIPIKWKNSLLSGCDYIF